MHDKSAWKIGLAQSAMAVVCDGVAERADVVMADRVKAVPLV